MKNASKPNIVPDMPNPLYHADPAIGSSGLKLIHERSPMHYWAAYLDPRNELRAATPAQRTGTAWHTATFEPGAFDDRYIILPDGLDRRTKEGKQLWAEIQASGKEPLKPGEHAALLAMAAAAHAVPVSAVLFQQHKGVAETSIFWTDPITGVRCKCRPDYAILPCAAFPHGLIVDGKTCEDASPEEFPRSVLNYGYHMSAAHYADGFQIAYGTSEPPPFILLAQEKTAPYATAYYNVGPDLLAYGRKLNAQAMRVYADCLDAGRWPGYPTEITDIQTPAWAQKQIAEFISEGAAA